MARTFLFTLLFLSTSFLFANERASLWWQPYSNAKAKKGDVAIEVDFLC